MLSYKRENCDIKTREAMICGELGSIRSRECVKLNEKIPSLFELIDAKFLGLLSNFFYSIFRYSEMFFTCVANMTAHVFLILFSHSHLPPLFN